MEGKGKKETNWPMRLANGPYAPETTREIFKCVGCGAETEPTSGWNGAPDKHRCKPGCPCGGDWDSGRVSADYRKNFDRIFPDAPGAGF